MTAPSPPESAPAARFPLTQSLGVGEASRDDALAGAPELLDDGGGGGGHGSGQLVESALDLLVGLLARPATDDGIQARAWPLRHSESGEVRSMSRR